MSLMSSIIDHCKNGRENLLKDFDGYIDGFRVEIFVYPKQENRYEASLIELPHFMESGSTSREAISKLKIRWETYKKECLEKGEKIPIPASQQKIKHWADSVINLDKK